MKRKRLALVRVSPDLWRSRISDLIVMRSVVGKGWTAIWTGWLGNKEYRQFATLRAAKSWYRTF